MRFTFYFSTILTILLGAYFLFLGDGSSYDPLIEQKQAAGDLEMASMLTNLQVEQMQFKATIGIAGVLALVVAISSNLALRTKEKEKAAS